MQPTLWCNPYSVKCTIKIAQICESPVSLKTMYLILKFLASLTNFEQNFGTKSMVTVAFYGYHIHRMTASCILLAH